MATLPGDRSHSHCVEKETEARVIRHFSKIPTVGTMAPDFSVVGSHSQTLLPLVCASVASVARFGVYCISGPSSLTNCAVSKSGETEQGFLLAT